MSWTHDNACKKTHKPLWCNIMMRETAGQHYLEFINQLPCLRGRWVPGIPRGFLCGQPTLNRKLPPWLANPHSPAMSSHSSHLSHWWNSGRKKNRDGEDAKWTAPQTTAQTLDKELADPSRVQSYHEPCEPALMGLTAGSLLSSWAAWPLSLWTAKPVDRLNAKLVNR